jgi:acyl-CoA reductase-like NAD-dependent aldehyde dehydrogenase
VTADPAADHPAANAADHPATLAEISPSVDDAVRAAVGAAPAFAATPAAQRRDALYACADALTRAGDELIAVASEETGLTTARLTGELARMTNQLRLLGDFVAAGRHQPGIASPGAAPDGSDLRLIAVPIGPVAVFPASNFPFAFGVFGGDTGSALAAGCPVVIKAHPAHPRTGRRLFEVGAPAFGPGVASMVEGGADVSIALVTAPGIRAVGFTGSYGGGRALIDAAATRNEPIPVYAEMGSLNPVFVLPGAADPANAGALAAAVTGSAGQLCTKPGLVFVPSDAMGFASELAREIAAADVHRMLTPGMADHHADWIAQASKRYDGVAVGTGDPQPVAVVVPAAALDEDPALLDEHFGPSTVIVTAEPAQYASIAARLPGQLTATMHATDADRPAVAALVPALIAIAGRVVYNGVPTGVAVTDAMQHGGPWPASSPSWSTSVGTESVHRFVRPVAIQGLPDGLLD